MMNWREILVAQQTPIIQALRIIDAAAMQIAIVVDEHDRLLGTVTDGDIRRGILRGISLEQPISTVMNVKPTVVRVNESRETILSMMRRTKIRQIPVVDENGRVVNLEVLSDILQSFERPNRVVLMAGGLGVRLKPLTDECPKPLLKVGAKPILETILENFMEYGFRHFYVSVNYRAEMVEKYFGDGSRWGVDIRYIKETKRLGTAGCLSLLPEKPQDPIIVMNGDLLTKVNFKQLLDFHLEHIAQATMCVREYELQVPFGVVKLNDHRLLGIDEKPMHRFFVNAGIYVLNPEAVASVPQDEYFDMPCLFDKLIERKAETAVFPIREYWADIGQLADYERVNGEFAEVFK